MPQAFESRPFRAPRKPGTRARATRIAPARSRSASDERSIALPSAVLQKRFTQVKKAHGTVLNAKGRASVPGWRSRPERVASCCAALRAAAGTEARAPARAIGPTAATIVASDSRVDGVASSTRGTAPFRSWWPVPRRMSLINGQSPDDKCRRCRRVVRITQSTFRFWAALKGRYSNSPGQRRRRCPGYRRII